VVLADGLRAGLDVGVEPLPGADRVAVGVPPAALGGVAGDADDLLSLVAADVQQIEDLHDLGEVRAAVCVLQPADLYARLLDETRRRAYEASSPR
jgi:hypothetical protein